MKVAIKKIDNNRFAVELHIDAFGADVVAVCGTENEARACAAGVVYGMNAVKRMIGIGPTFSGRVEVA